MPTHIISATEASRKLSIILNKVHYQGEHYEIKRGKEIIAQIIPVSHKNPSIKVRELKEFFKKLPTIDTDDQLAFVKDIEEIRAQNKIEDKSWD
jgi:antitoxin (DNA-binding transcriptional repressor) of toxin-antitoxin stability system